MFKDLKLEMFIRENREIIQENHDDIMDDNEDEFFDKLEEAAGEEISWRTIISEDEEDDLLDDEDLDDLDEEEFDDEDLDTLEENFNLLMDSIDLNEDESMASALDLNELDL